MGEVTLARYFSPIQCCLGGWAVLIKLFCLLCVHFFILIILLQWCCCNLPSGRLDFCSFSFMGTCSDQQSRFFSDHHKRSWGGFTALLMYWAVRLAQDTQVDETSWVPWHIVLGPRTATKVLLFAGGRLIFNETGGRKDEITYATIMLMSLSPFSPFNSSICLLNWQKMNSTSVDYHNLNVRHLLINVSVSSILLLLAPSNLVNTFSHRF